jgi:hypothetical protein
LFSSYVYHLEHRARPPAGPARPTPKIVVASTNPPGLYTGLALAPRHKPAACSRPELIPDSSTGMRSETAVRRRHCRGRVEGDDSRVLPQVKAGVVGMAGLEPAASSLSAIEGSALCGPAFPQVVRDRQGRSYAFLATSFQAVQASQANPHYLRELQHISAGRCGAWPADGWGPSTTRGRGPGPGRHDPVPTP